MTKALRTILLTALIAPLSAQDRIHWTDGRVTERVKVLSFSLHEIEYRKGGSVETGPSDKVAKLHVTKVRDRYTQAYGASSSQQPATFLQLAERYNDDPFLAQFGYFEAILRFEKAGDTGSMFSALDEMAKRYPDNGFLTMSFVYKINSYLRKGKNKDAAKVALRYKSTAIGQGYPAGYKLEADYYETLTSGLSGAIPQSQVRGVMERIFTDAQADYPLIANLARLKIANSLRDEGQVAQAKQAYESILEQNNLSEPIRGGAWLGLGHISFAAGNPANREPYGVALKQFLRVYLSNHGAAPAIVAESLEFGAKAAEKWGGADAARMRKRLQRTLAREFPDWGK